MTVEVPDLVRSQIPGWLVARRYGVPAWMVEQATARRAAGDWRGACAAARIDVRPELGELRDRYGAELAGQVEEDLRHLVPDLVRWHVPRRRGDPSGRIRPKGTIVLTRYDEAALWVGTPMGTELPQRLTLGFGPVQYTPEEWDTARYLWDDRHTGALLHRLGGGDRVPFHDRDGRRLTPDELPFTAPDPGDPVTLAEWITICQDSGQAADGWRAAGIEADFTAPEGWRSNTWLSRVGPPEEAYAMVSALAPRLRAAPWERVALRSDRGGHPLFVILTNENGRISARLDTREVANVLPGLPHPRWQRFPDLELLRLGRLTPAGLHPLVRAALFPGSDAAYTPLPTAAPAEVPVRCRGEWHRVGWRDGRIEALSHDPDEARRERVLRSLGGAVPGCFLVTQTWRGGAGRLPRSLRELRWHALCAITHGDGVELDRLLAYGVDLAGIRDRRARNPLHLVTHFGTAELVPKLVAAGLDINGVDAEGRTPLLGALFDGAPAALVRALLDAGTDPTRPDGEGCTALHLLRCTESATILPWLLDAGLELEKVDEMGRTPLLAMLHTAAPPEAIRALLDAGADVTATGEYDEEGVDDLIGIYKRTDLDFLREAWKAANPG